MNISVAMAAYNGEKYIEEQLDSILKQLIPGDELVISLDESTDKTESIINMYKNKFDNIVVVKNCIKKKGYVNNFLNAFNNTTNEIIFYADQDDIWLEGKRDLVTDIFEVNSNIEFVVHNCINTDSSLKHNNVSYFEQRGYPSSMINNVIKLRYIGCCSAFRKSFLEKSLPFPLGNRSIDWAMGSLSLFRKSFFYLDKNLLLHRIHDSNTTPKTNLSLSQHIYIRFKILKYILIDKVFI